MINLRPSSLAIFPVLFVALNAAAGAAWAQTWTPPLGIPRPAWGIAQTKPARPASWTADVNNYYYVSSSGCSDSRTYGNPNAPRCTIPSSLAAGAYVEIHGTYTNDHDPFGWTGTADAPIWIVGQSSTTKPTMTGYFQSSSSARYVIFEDLLFAPANSSDSSFGAPYLVEGANHIALRKIEVQGNSSATGGLGMGTWGYSGSAYLEEIVVKEAYIHDLGVVSNTGDRDAHCITVNGNARNVWVVDSELARCEGDGMQVEAQHGSGRGVSKIHHIYFGRNKSHGHKQSGFWVKHASDVIASQNELYDIRESSSGAGQCTGAQYNPERAWFIFNRMHNCEIGVFVGSDDGSGDGSSIFIVGNIITAITNPGDAADTYNAGCMSIRGGVNVTVVNNTCYDADGGLYAPPAGVKFTIANNIFANRHASSGMELALENAGSSTATNNVFYRSGGVSIDWNSTTYTSVPFAGQCSSNCSTADPKFVNAAGGDFHLQASSSAVDKGQVAAVYATFQTQYGQSLAYDFYGGSRPSGSAWDIGAAEYGSGGATPLPVPEAPTNIRILP